MITPNPTDSGQATGEQDANLGTSQQPGDQPNSQTPEPVPAWAKEIQRDLAETKRLFQSGKDRAVSKISKQLDEYKPILDGVKAKMDGGLSFDQAVREFQIDQILAGNQSQSSAPASQGSGTSSAAQFVDGDFELNLVKELGLSTTDTEVSTALLANAGNPAKLALSLSAIHERRKNQPAPNPATIAQAPGASASAANIEQLTGEYKTKMRAAVGNKTALSELRKQYAGLGVPVYDIDFT